MPSINQTLVGDLADVCAHFATAAVRGLSLEAQLELAELVHSQDATFEVIVRIAPFAATVRVVAADGLSAVDVGRFA